MTPRKAPSQPLIIQILTAVPAKDLVYIIGALLAGLGFAGRIQQVQDGVDQVAETAVGSQMADADQASRIDSLEARIKALEKRAPQTKIVYVTRKPQPQKKNTWFKFDWLFGRG